MISGQWGAFFRNSAIRANLTVGDTQLTAYQIDQMFAWGKGLGAAEGEKRREYARAMVDLMALPTGRNLFREIIIACHGNHTANRNEIAPKRPERAVFMHDEGASALIYESKKACQCELNLEMNDEKISKLKEGHNVLLVHNTVTNELDFIGVAIPPALDLAHELGHFLYALNTPRVDGVDGSPSVHNAVEARAQEDYAAIFNDILGDASAETGQETLAAKEAFEGLWNHGIYSEAINILPTARILPADGFCYGDGIMIGEAFNTWGTADARCPRFFELTDAKGIGAAKIISLKDNTGEIATGDVFSPISFVRFSHANSLGFYGRFNQLNNDGQTIFKRLVLQLLGKIRISPEVRCGISDLPRI
jgi:hypothetical protein